MDIRKIKKLIELLEESGLSEIEIKEGEESIRLSRSNSTFVEIPQTRIASPMAPAPAHHPIEVAHHKTEDKMLSSHSGHKVKSPMVGTVYMAASPESPPYVEKGQMVKAGTILCIVEAMKMYNEIEADRSGKIVEILVNNGDPVEYDQPLFIIEE